MKEDKVPETAITPPTLELIVKFDDDVPPEGVLTVTVTVPAFAINAELILAVNRVLLTNAVVNAAPFQLITDVETKLLPSTVNVNDDEPAVILEGLNDVRTGVGLVTVLAGIATFFDVAGELEQTILPE